MNTDGSNLSKLTNNGLIDYQPAFSPDGGRITFTSHRAGNSDIYVMNLDGTEQTKITTSPRPDFQSDWQPLRDTSVPKRRAACKNSGFKDFGFKNQGQCIKAVNQAD